MTGGFHRTIRHHHRLRHSLQNLEGVVIQDVAAD
jgi:hypothetical protein